MSPADELDRDISFISLVVVFSEWSNCLFIRSQLRIDRIQSDKKLIQIVQFSFIRRRRRPFTAQQKFPLKFAKPSISM